MKPAPPDQLVKKKAAPKRKRRRDETDDTPRAFARVMAYQTKGWKTPNGLDDGNSTKQSKKRKREQDTTEPAKQDSKAQDLIPTIKAGERMSDFAARVNASLPVVGLVRNKRKDPLGLKGNQTKMERRMQRVQKEWREVEAKRKEKVEEAREEAGEEDDETGLAQNVSRGLGGKKSKKGNRRKVIGEQAADEDDPWAVVKVSRNEKSSGLIGLHDVVLAPPRFSKVPTEKFRVQDGARVNVMDVPNTAGSLRRREELGQARQSVVEGYRRMMQGKRKEGS